jgi:hypothetical protein
MRSIPPPLPVDSRQTNTYYYYYYLETKIKSKENKEKYQILVIKIISTIYKLFLHPEYPATISKSSHRRLGHKFLSKFYCLPPLENRLHPPPPGGDNIPPVPMYYTVSTDNVLK